MIFFCYILVGMPLNFGTAVVVWGYLKHICRHRPGLADKLQEIHTCHGLRLDLEAPTWVKFLIVQALWPICVVNIVIDGCYAINEAKRRIRYGY